MRLLIVLLAITLIPLTAAEAPAKYENKSSDCAIPDLAGSSCVVAQAGVVSAACDASSCSVAVTGSADGRSPLPGPLTLYAAVVDCGGYDRYGDQPGRVNLCTTDGFGTHAACEYDAEFTRGLDVGECASLALSTSLWHANVLSIAAVTQWINLCNDGEGGSVTLQHSS